MTSEDSCAYEPLEELESDYKSYSSSSMSDSKRFKPIAEEAPFHVIALTLANMKNQRRNQRERKPKIVSY